MQGSVENTEKYQKHGVVGEDHQVQVAASTGRTASGGMRPLTAFEHRDDGFHLATVVVVLTVETNLHQPTDGGWKERANALLFSRER